MAAPTEDFRRRTVTTTNNASYKKLNPGLNNTTKPRQKMERAFLKQGLDQNKRAFAGF